MTTPAYCTSCGHELGIGRFCTNCGRPVPGRHPEAEPVADVRPPATVVVPATPAPGPPLPPPPPAPPAPAPPAVLPPPVASAPPAARYPLFADADPHATVVRPPDLPPVPASPTGGRTDDQDRGGRVWLVWVAALVAVTLVAGLGALLLLGGGDDSADDRSSRDSTASDDTSDGDTGPDGDGGPDDGDGAVAAPDPEDVVDLTGDVSATVPAVGPPSTDLAGQPVTFVAANMWDGVTATAWRMPGDGTGETLVFELGGEVVLTEVGLVNGYAKTDQGVDWYRGNRRIQRVEWEFDDGTRVIQDLDDVRDLQSVTVDPVRTATVRLRLVAVSTPGRGPAARDNTAISEVRFLGAP